MSKIKEGVLIRIINKAGIYASHDTTEGKEYRVENVSEEGGVYIKDDANDILCITKTELHAVELANPKPTKNQRITALENEVAELKLIVHQLRKPSAEVQGALDKADWARGEFEGVIGFEGKWYRKVDREACEGDVVMFTINTAVEDYVTISKPYLTYREDGELRITDNQGDCLSVYNGMLGGTPENVEVYELIAEDKQKTPNQLRAEIIEKAKRSIDERFMKGCRGVGEVVDSSRGHCKVEFIVNEEKRTVVALLRLAYVPNAVPSRGIAKCMPGDVYNEHIGKAIALGRALGLDVSEFEQAVQPTLAIGQIVEYMNSTAKLISSNEYATIIDGTARVCSYYAKHGMIINDTNAQYETTK